MTHRHPNGGSIPGSRRLGVLGACVAVVLTLAGCSGGLEAVSYTHLTLPTIYSV